MPKFLSEAAINQYREDGYFFPVRMIDAERAATHRAKLEAFEQSNGQPVQGALRSKCHLLFKWVDEVMRENTILDAVEDLIGPDILCGNTLFWTKEPNSKPFVSWHQDQKYVGLDTDEFVTVWLAISPSTRENGCLRVLPGSHKGELMAHEDRYEPDNMLTREQEIAVEVDESKAVPMSLDPGEASLHTVRLAHASAPNRSSERRVGLSLHYIPTRTKQLIAEWDSAALVRGEDRFGHFTHTPRPKEDFDPAAVSFHEKAANAFRAESGIDLDRLQSNQVVPADFDVEFFLGLAVSVKQGGVDALQQRGIGVTDVVEAFATVDRFCGQDDAENTLTGLDVLIHFRVGDDLAGDGADERIGIDPRHQSCGDRELDCANDVRVRHWNSYRMEYCMLQLSTVTHRLWTNVVNGTSLRSGTGFGARRQSE